MDENGAARYGLPDEVECRYAACSAGGPLEAAASHRLRPVLGSKELNPAIGTTDPRMTLRCSTPPPWGTMATDLSRQWHVVIARTNEPTRQGDRHGQASSKRIHHPRRHYRKPRRQRGHQGRWLVLPPPGPRWPAGQVRRVACR